MVERMGKELAQAVEDAIVAGAKTELSVVGSGVSVDGVFFGMSMLTHRPVLLLEVPCKTIREIINKAVLDEKRKEIEKLKNELNELEK